MRITTVKLMAALLLLFCARPAAASYRCELDGKIDYADTPCTAGVSKHLPPPPAPRSADMRAAQQRAQREALALAHLGEQRRAADERELRAERVHAKLAASNKKKCDALALQKKWRDEDAARAPAKSADRLKQVARRVSDQYAMQCKP